MKRPLASSLFILVGLLLSQAAFLQSVSAADDGDRSFNVRNYGAAGDGKTPDSPAIDKAITAAATASRTRPADSKIGSTRARTRRTPNWRAWGTKPSR